MKKLIFTASMLLTFCVNAQEKKEPEAPKTKMELFTSKTGTILKFVDTKLPVFKTNYEGVESRIRKITTGTTSMYFYQIIKEGKYSNPTASIEYADLLEIIKALKILKTDAEKDATSPDYLENKFVTVDGFQVGYYVSNSKTVWYLKLERFGSDNTLFLTGDTVDIIFNEAKNKIDELKKNI